MPASLSLEKYVSEIHEFKQGSVPKSPPGQTVPQELHVSTLKRAIMLLKLVSFLASIKCRAAGVHHAEDLLWDLLSDMLLSYQPQAAQESHLQEIGTHEPLIRSVLLEMLDKQACVLFISQSGRDSLHASMALKILKSLMTGIHVQAFGAKMLQQGMQSANIMSSYQHKQMHA